MRYQVLLTDEAKEDLQILEHLEKKKVLKAFDIIENVSIGAVNIRPIGNKIFEIKADNIRSLFCYNEGRIIIVALIFIKKSQKTPMKYIDKATKILKEYN